MKLSELRKTGLYSGEVILKLNPLEEIMVTAEGNFGMDDSVITKYYSVKRETDADYKNLSISLKNKGEIKPKDENYSSAREQI
ncbi:MAG: hypothetical protein AABW50_00255 [Nanoarchaeota archaeon]